MVGYGLPLHCVGRRLVHSGLHCVVSHQGVVSMSKIKPQDHPDYVGGWVWTKLELDWINERIGTLETALFQAQEAAKDLETRLTKTEGWLNEAMWNYGELKREQLANSEETSNSPMRKIFLTEEEIMLLVNEFFYLGMQPHVRHYIMFSRAIEVKLKEKS